LGLLTPQIQIRAFALRGNGWHVIWRPGGLDACIAGKPFSGWKIRGNNHLARDRFLLELWFVQIATAGQI
jgi:hypothetical protein